ncbi:murein L,D-transpeptidase YafK [Novosphingobium chloroacetimidivorans]|uniref:Murein L,D-transpeptidase YafK n=1 Tax=Novosphingobium chloroacetimidivorans TaxID=1428314 RepID=A0A7W7K8V4_9SPHN|nr:L,D-transpeptidase family protein [Novosphingobium chloroacetimidivorans]MBB4857683.1 murein L,D-transpeptidase YafK [Novosphingobium chloroacetimidivorans]
MRRFTPIVLLIVAGCSSAPLPPRPAPSSIAHAPRPALRADFLRVRKAARTLEVWSGRQLLLTVADIQLGPEPHGAKRFEGDGRTPEGRYRIDWRNPRSAYHLSLHVSYPTAAQVAAARAVGRSAGGLIMIHGQPNASPERIAGDWTDGCIAVSNREIETLWRLVPDGAEIEIVP